MSADDRSQQILQSAIQFFSAHGLDGQMRVLAAEIGVTHTLLYHYFPTKQALLDRVYLELFEGRWRVEWEKLLDDPAISCEEKFTRFYCDYARDVLSREFVRIFIFSGLSDRYITDRFFELLRRRLFPRLIRETRALRGVVSRAKPTQAEFELLMGLHGGIFYIGVRRWIYGQPVHPDASIDYDSNAIRTCVQTYLASSPTVLAADDVAHKRMTKATAAPRKGH